MDKIKIIRESLENIITDCVTLESAEAQAEQALQALAELEQANSVQGELVELKDNIIYEALQYGNAALEADLGITYTTFSTQDGWGRTNDKKEQLDRIKKAIKALQSQQTTPVSINSEGETIQTANGGLINKIDILLLNFAQHEHYNEIAEVLNECKRKLV